MNLSIGFGDVAALCANDRACSTAFTHCIAGGGRNEIILRKIVFLCTARHAGRGCNAACTEARVALLSQKNYRCR